MVGRTPVSEKVSDIKYFGYGVYTVVVTTSDTITLDDFVTTENLKLYTILKNSDGSALTATVLNNVVTVTSAAITDQECTLFAFGVRA